MFFLFFLIIKGSIYLSYNLLFYSNTGYKWTNDKNHENSFYFYPQIILKT